MISAQPLRHFVLQVVLGKRWIAVEQFGQLASAAEVYTHVGVLRLVVYTLPRQTIFPSLRSNRKQAPVACEVQDFDNLDHCHGRVARVEHDVALNTHDR